MNAVKFCMYVHVIYVNVLLLFCSKIVQLNLVNRKVLRVYFDGWEATTTRAFAVIKRSVFSVIWKRMGSDINVLRMSSFELMFWLYLTNLHFFYTFIDHSQWPWPYFKVAASSKGFAWKCYVLFRRNSNFARLLITSRRI